MVIIECLHGSFDQDLLIWLLNDSEEMESSTETRRGLLFQKLQTLYLDFETTLDQRFESNMLCERGVDAVQIDLVDETFKGGVYFQPMSQERLDSLEKRPAMYEIPFWAGSKLYPFRIWTNASVRKARIRAE